MAWHLVAYDVRDARRLRRCAKLLEGYGERVQYSLFRCRLDAAGRRKLRWELGDVLAPEDDLLIVPLCGTCAAKVSDTGMATDGRGSRTPPAADAAGGDRNRGEGGDWSAPPPAFEVL